MPPQELQIIVSAINNMGPVVENISQGIQRLIALQEQSATASQASAQATAQLLAVQQQAVQAIQALGTALQQASVKHTEAARSAQQHGQAERGATAAITEEDQALREHIRLLEAMVGLRAQQVRYAEATGSGTVAVQRMMQEIEALKATEQGYRQLASTLDSSSTEYVRLQTAAVRAGTEIAQIQQKIDASIQVTLDHMRKQREETERLYAGKGFKSPTVGDMLAGKPLVPVDARAAESVKQVNTQLQEQVRLLEATATLRKDESSLAATSRNVQTYVTALKAQREALVNLDSGYQSMMATLSKTSPEYLKAASASARVRTEIAGLDETIRKGGGSFEVLGMSVEKLGRRVREALVFFVAFRIFWEAWNFVTARIRDLFDLEQQLKRVQSATIFDPSGMAKLNDLTVVTTTNMARFGTTVKETADAMYELISAGISWVETQEGLPTVLGLVKLGVSDVGTASRAVSAIYKTWGTDFKDIGDIISTVLITTQSEIGGFITAFQRVAATAKLSGLDFKQTAALVGILNDAMIFGGNAGRALRQGLSQIAQERGYLQKMGVMIDSTKDMGEQIDLIAVQLGRLLGSGKISLGQLGDLFKHFNIQGTQAIAAIAVMADKYKNLTVALEGGKGAMAEMLDIRMDNAINQWDRLTAAITANVNALVSGQGHLAGFLRLSANMFAHGPIEGGNLFGIQAIAEKLREGHRELLRFREQVKNLSSMPTTDPLVAKDLFQAKVNETQQLEQQTAFLQQIDELYKKLGPDARKEVDGLITYWKSLYEVQKKSAKVLGLPVQGPEDYETIVKEVKKQVALLEAQATLRKEQAKLLETSGRESDLQKSLQMQREAVITLDAGMQKLLPQLHKGTQEQLQLATASVKNKIEIAGFNKELLQFGSQFQVSERAFVSIADSIGLLEEKTRATTVTLTKQTEQTQTFGVTLYRLLKPVSTLSEEMEKLEGKYDKVGTAAAKNAVWLDRQNKAALDAALRAIDLREKEARASGLFDAETEAELNRERISADEKRLEFLRTRIALMEQLNSENEADVETLERFRNEYDAMRGQIIDLNATQGDFWTAFSRGAQTALSEMSSGFKETFGEAKSLMFELQKSISDVLFDSITKGFDNATDGLKRFGQAILRYLTNEVSKDIIRSMGGWLKGAMSGGQGASASQGGGASGLFSMFSSFMGIGGSNPAASVLQWGAAPAGSSATLGAPMMAGQAGGVMSALGPASSMLGPFAMIAAAAPIVYQLGKFLGGKIFGGGDAAKGAGWGSLLGPVGFLAGGLLGKLFGSTPKGRLKANILPFDLDALTSGALRDLDTAVKGTRVGAVSVNVAGNVYKASKEHKLQEEFARALNDLFIDMVKGIKVLIPQLPKMVGAELDAALESLSETGLQFEKFSKSGSKAKKKLKKHLENLPNAMIEAVVEELGFGTLDLKMMGGGDAAKGFEGLLSALGGLSAVLKRVTGTADSFTGTLEEFADKSIEFFETFRRSGETFTETVARVNQGFAELFGVMDQLDMEIGTSSAAGFQGLVDVYQRSVERIQELADAGMVAVESGASPDEVAAAAQALRDAMQVSQDVLQRIAAGLQALNAAVVTGVDLYADLEIRIRALDGAATALDELIDGAYRLAVSTHNIGAQISIFESVLKVVGSDFTTFTVALPRMAGAFNELMAAIRSGGNNAEAVTQLQALAQAVTNGAQAAYQGIANGASRARDAAQTAADARIQALEAERDAIQDVVQKQRDANQAQLDAIRQWKGIVESTKAQLVDLFNLLAPTHPETSFNEVLEQFRSAVGGFGPSSAPEAALQIQDLAKQVLQLAQGVPGMDLPSLAFQALAAEVKTALEAVQTVAENQPSEADLLGQIATSTTDNSVRLAEIDAAIRAEQTGLQQALQSISAQEQEQIAFVNAQQVAAMNEIRLHLGARLMGLQAEQEAARAILTQITGDLSFEQFIAQKQSESVAMLGQIRDVLKNYLGSIIQGLGYPMPSAASGMAYVPADGPVYLHRGERVLTTDENQRYSGGSGGGQQIVFSPQITVHADKDTDGRKVGEAIVREIKEAILYGELRQPIERVMGKR